jgi:hypothetical protein
VWLASISSLRHRLGITLKYTLKKKKETNCEGKKCGVILQSIDFELSEHHAKNKTKCNAAAFQVKFFIKCIVSRLSCINTVTFTVFDILEPEVRLVNISCTFAEKRSQLII